MIAKIYFDILEIFETRLVKSKLKYLKTKTS